MIYVLTVIVMISTGICWKIAKQKNLNVQFWIILGVCFGPLAIPFALLAKTRSLPT
jgi:hypothetical protein